MSSITEIFICAYCLTNIVYIVMCAWQRDILSMLVNKEYLIHLSKEPPPADGSARQGDKG